MIRKTPKSVKLGEHLPKKYFYFLFFYKSIPNDDDGGDIEGDEVKKLSLASLVER